MKDRDGNEWRMVPVNATEEMIADMLASKDFDGIWPAAIAAAPQFVAGEVTNEVAGRIANRIIETFALTGGREPGTLEITVMQVIVPAVRAELGPALGLVEIHEPTPEECARIAREFYGDIPINAPDVAGGVMFDAVRAVMWPKEGL